MTKVEITNTDPRFVLQIEDHAGKPEVCAGISALMYSLEGFLCNHEDRLFLHVANIKDPGYAYISFELDGPYKEIKGAWELVMIGLLQIEKSYPDFCKVIISEN